MRKYIAILTLVLTATISGCKKDYLDLAVNPNSPSQTTPQLSLAGNLTQIPNYQVNDYTIYDVWSGYLSWNGGIVPPPSIFQYEFINSDFSPAIWSDWYTNASNFNTLIATSSKSAALANFQAIATIMKAYDFEQLVDNFNNVPYSQAFQPSTILFPKYDDAASIYADLGKQLDAAVALIAKSGGATNPGASDVMFNGDMAQWAQFANTLHLRLAIRESNLGSNPLKAGLPTSSASYVSKDALLNPGYLNVAGKENPWYALSGFDANGNPTGNYYRANDFAIKLLQSTTDTARLKQIFTSVINPDDQTSTAPFYRGNIFGDDVNIKGTKFTSGAGPGLITSPTQSSVMMLSAESYFLQAEAALRGYIPGGQTVASALYIEGIQASFAYLGVTDTDAENAYIAKNPLPADLAGGVKAIITQKWIALANGYDSFEQFNEYRRTGYPNLPSTVDPAALSTHLPTRIFYPDTELDSNPDQYKAAGGLTISSFTSKIFWAK